MKEPRIGIAAALLIGATILLGGALATSASAQLRQDDAGEGRLRLLAKANNGTHRETLNYEVEDPATSLEELANDSFLVVVGTAITNRSELTPRGGSIVMIHEVQVEDALKGRVRTGDSISVAVPGGRVEFDDGTTAQVSFRNYLQPRPGQRYLWFLQRVGPNATTTADTSLMPLFEPSDGPLGIFQLASPRGIVQTSGLFREPLAREISGRRLSPTVFIAEVRGIVR